MNLENDLVLNICDFIKPEKEAIESGLTACTTPAGVLGKILMHRMGGVAYGVLKECNLLGAVNREFRTTLNSIYTANCIKNQKFNEGLNFLAEHLSDIAAPYAVLKGAFLAEKYPMGYRTSNDVDILVSPEHISEISELLERLGFKQGYIRNGVFSPASRVEIINSRMNRGETVPYIIPVGENFMEYLEVDINFSLDYKPGDGNTVDKMLSSTRTTKHGLQTLTSADFFIHLCAHLYKEATTFAWVEMNRDLSLYKFADIYLLASEFTQEDYSSLEKRIYEMGTEKECAYAMFGTMLLFSITDNHFVELCEKLYNENPDCINTVIDPAKGKKYTYTVDFSARFFDDNRKECLKEVGNLESTTYV